MNANFLFYWWQWWSCSRLTLYWISWALGTGVQTAHMARTCIHICVWVFFFFFFFVGCQSPITTLWSIFLWLLVLWGTFWMLTVMLFVHLNELVFYQCSQLFWSHFVFCRCLKISSDMPWFWWLVMPTCNRQKLDKCKERRLLI